jgi:NADH:ubiquinone oxidoreductase subunit H
LVFVVVVIIRIATPRFKIESLTKLGWSYGLIIIVIGFLFFLLGYFFI